MSVIPSKAWICDLSWMLSRLLSLYSWIIILLLISQLWYTDIYCNKSIVLCFVWIVISKGKRTSSLFFEGAGRKLHSRSDVLRSTCTTNWNSVHGIQTEKGWLCSNYYIFGSIAFPSWLISLQCNVLQNYNKCLIGPNNNFNCLFLPQGNFPNLKWIF